MIDGDTTWKLAIQRHKYHLEWMPKTVADSFQNPGRGLLLSLHGAIDAADVPQRPGWNAQMQQGFPAVFRVQ
jgi:hypothetical protein